MMFECFIELQTQVSTRTDDDNVMQNAHLLQLSSLTDRQASRDSQADTLADKQTQKHRHRQADRQMNRHAHRQTDGQTIELDRKGSIALDR